MNTNKKNILTLVFTGIPITIVIIVLVLLNIYVFSPVPGNDYYDKTHIKVYNLNEAIKITDNKLPLEKIVVKEMEPFNREYILEHIYDLPSFDNRLSFSIKLSYIEGDVGEINVFIPFDDDSKNNFLIDNFFAIESLQKTEEEVYISGKACKIYKLLSFDKEKKESDCELSIISFKCGDFEYYIKSNINNPYVPEIVDNLIG